jgi:hypothetical protein
MDIPDWLRNAADAAAEKSPREMTEEEYRAFADKVKPKLTLGKVVANTVDVVLLTLFAVGCFRGYLATFLVIFLRLFWWGRFVTAKGLDGLTAAQFGIVCDADRNIGLLEAKLDKAFGRLDRIEGRLGLDPPPD